MDTLLFKRKKAIIQLYGSMVSISPTAAALEWFNPVTQRDVSCKVGTDSNYGYSTTDQTTSSLDGKHAEPRNLPMVKKSYDGFSLG